jgi:ribosome-binding ATPase
MELGIIGLPKSGKTTLFNALTKGRVQASATGRAQPDTLIGTAKLSDDRLPPLCSVLNPAKVVPAEVLYVDTVIAKARGGITGQLRTRLGAADALIHVVRLFQDAYVPLPESGIDPERDIDIMALELGLADLDIIDRRLSRIEDLTKSARALQRDQLLQEHALLARVKEGLEHEVPIYRQGLTEEEAKQLRSYDFLSAKPTMVVLNVGEGQISEASSLEARVAARFPQLKVAALCAKLEMELAALSETDAAEFRRDMGAGEEAVERIVKTSYDLLGLITFFTGSSSEVRAWTVLRDTPAPIAAGKIHTDMEKGFIRAEVVRHEDLVASGSMAEAKKKGLVRMEGKSYLVQDGDLITFLFKV